MKDFHVFLKKLKEIFDVIRSKETLREPIPKDIWLKHHVFDHLLLPRNLHNAIIVFAGIVLPADREASK